MAVNDLEYKELRLDLVDLTEGVVGSFLFYYDDEVKNIYELGISNEAVEAFMALEEVQELGE